MGNTITVAEITACQILHPNSPLCTPKYTHLHSYGDEISERCPMHKKCCDDLTNLAEQCPISKGDAYGINPLNMVCINNTACFKCYV